MKRGIEDFVGGGGGVRGEKLEERSGPTAVPCKQAVSTPASNAYSCT